MSISEESGDVGGLSQREMAKELGVSHMTVSRALRGENGVSEKTRERILDIYRRAGIPLPPSRKAPNPMLLHTLCAIAPAPTPDTDFHTRLLAGFERGSCDCGSELANLAANVQGEYWPQMIVRKQADGVVVVWGDEHNPMPHADCPVAAVFVFHGPPHADIVDADNFMAGYQLGVHLAALGHRRVAFHGTKSLISNERLAGLRTGLETQGGECPPALTFRRVSPFRDAAGFADRLLAETGWRPDSSAKPFTALVCYNDLLASHAVMRLQELGVSVPEDISVAGFDGVNHAWYDGPKLTTCALPLEDIGAEAARMVYWRVEHPNAPRRKLSLETELVEGESVGEVKIEN